MATGMNIGAFKNLILSGMERLARLERTRKGRQQLAAEYRAEAARLREASGPDLWMQAGGEMNSHVASPAELARRALERAAKLEEQARELDAIKGNNYNRWNATL